MVDILLATYNGEKYLKAQIMSILYQTYTDWTLYIHDDGSTDGTIDIIKEFESIYSNIYYVNDGISHLGPGMNFMHLLNSSNSSLVCFCDQDDIWFDNKLEIMVNAFSGVDMSKPIVVYSQARDFYSQDNNRIGKYSSPCKHYSIKDSLFRNGGIQGCAAMFNASMRKLMQREQNYVAMHDHLLMLLGVVTQGIRYIDVPLFLYRQHDNNTTTHQPQNAREYLDLLNKHGNIPVIEKSYYKGVQSFYKTYFDLISQTDIKLFKLYFEMPYKSRIVRSLTILGNMIPLRGSVTKLFLKNMLRKSYI